MVTASSNGGPSPEAALGSAVALIAIVLFASGMFGIVYKVMADAVSEGIGMSGGLR